METPLLSHLTSNSGNHSRIMRPKCICEVATTSVVRIRGGGGPGHVSMAKWARFCILNSQEMPGSSEQGRKLRGLCIPRSLPRWHDPDPLGVLSPAYIPENRKGRRGGARAMYRVLSDEAEEFRGYHCLGRSLQDSAHQLVQLMCHQIVSPSCN